MAKVTMCDRCKKIVDDGSKGENVAQLVITLGNEQIADLGICRECAERVKLSINQRVTLSQPLTRKPKEKTTS